MSLAITDVLAGTAPWAALYACVFCVSHILGPVLFAHCKAMNTADRSYWASSMCSTVNALIVTPMAYTACQALDLWAPSASWTAASPHSTACCYALLGYTLFDTLPLLYHRNAWVGSATYIVHHVAVLLGWGASVVLLRRQLATHRAAWLGASALALMLALAGRWLVAV